MRKNSFRPAFAVAVLSALAASAHAEPAIRALDVAGLQIGGTTTITIDGADLAPPPRIVMSIPIAQQEVLPEATATRVRMQVTLPEGATPGLYNLRLANARGISAAVVVGVDTLPQRPFAAKIESLPVALHGRISGSTKLTTTFPGKAGQEILCEVEAARLGGKLRPVLHLYDPAGNHVAWSLPSPALHGDARLQAKLPTDGQYTLTLNDLQYAAAAPNHFRLKIGNWQYADVVFPPAVPREGTTELELIGNVATKATIPFHPPTGVTRVPSPWAESAPASGMRPVIHVSDLRELIEKKRADQLVIQQLPAAISGRLSDKGEKDRYRVAVKPGAKLRFELFAERIGSPLDGVLELQNEKGGRLAIADDVAGTADPRLDYTVPANVKTVTAAIADAHGRGGRQCVYRLIVTPLEAKSNPREDFDLTLEQGRFNIAAGGRQVVKLLARRRGFAGRIQGGFDELPNGVTAKGGEIPAGAAGTLLTLSAAKTPTSLVTVLRGEGVASKTPLTRVASGKAHPLAKMQPWLAEEIAIAVAETGEPAFDLNWGEIPGDALLTLGGKLKLPVQCTKPDGHDGPVRLTLITSQDTPLNRGRPDPNRMLRRESGAAVEIPAGKKSVEFSVLVPTDLPDVPWDMAFRGELLSKDKKKILAQTFTDARRLRTLNPVELQLTNPARQEVKLVVPTGAAVKLAGQVKRLDGLKGDVTVSASGLPPGVKAANVVVKAGKEDFQLEFKFPANFKPGEVQGVKLFATGKMDPKSPRTIRSKGVAVTFHVSRAKPADKKTKKKGKRYS